MILSYRTPLGLASGRKLNAALPAVSRVRWASSGQPHTHMVLARSGLLGAKAAHLSSAAELSCNVNRGILFFSTDSVRGEQAKGSSDGAQKSNSTNPTDQLVKPSDAASVDDNQLSTQAKAADSKLTLWQKIKKEAKHYWDGTKLLGYEIKVSSKLAAKMMAGYTLTRREDRQLKRTLQDIIRLVPFSVFVLIPFAELLLPVALKLFPNMLPSTYEDRNSKEARYKKLFKTRQKVSQFMKETVGGGTSTIAPNFSPEETAAFKEFFWLVKRSEQPSRELVLRVAHLFRDDTLLDNMSRPQLAAIARYMNIQSYGTSMVLRYLLRHRMRQIKLDDYVIEREGVESLNTSELQSACQARGFKVYGVSSGRMREDLSNWLQLRLKDKVPSTLLVLSSAYSYEGHNLDSFYEGISAVIAALPMEVYHEAELEMASDTATNEQRLEYLKEQEELIKDENKEEADSGHVISVQDKLNVDDDHPSQAEVTAKVEAESKAEEEANAKKSKSEAETIGKK